MNWTGIREDFGKKCYLGRVLNDKWVWGGAGEGGDDGGCAK